MSGAGERGPSHDPGRQPDRDPLRDPAVGRVRGRCAWWLSGQCKGDEGCTCLPRTEAAEPEPAGRWVRTGHGHRRVTTGDATTAVDG